MDIPVPTLVGQSVVVEPDAVRILDRRVFHFERTWVTCSSYEDVATAIEDMVTQSLGPMFAAMGGMVLAARTTSGRRTTASATSWPSCARSRRRAATWKARPRSWPSGTARATGRSASMLPS